MQLRSQNTNIVLLVLFSVELEGISFKMEAYDISCIRDGENSTLVISMYYFFGVRVYHTDSRSHLFPPGEQVCDGPVFTGVEGGEILSHLKMYLSCRCLIVFSHLPCQNVSSPVYKETIWFGNRMGSSHIDQRHANARRCMPLWWGLWEQMMRDVFKKCVGSCAFVSTGQLHWALSWIVCEQKNGRGERRKHVIIISGVNWKSRRTRTFTSVKSLEY